MASKRKADEITYPESINVSDGNALASRVKVNTSTDTPTTSPFLGLPGEIRNKIYGHVIAGSKASSWSTRLTKSKHDSIFGLLRVNKQVRQEFLGLLRPQATYHITLKSIYGTISFHVGGKTYNKLNETPLRDLVKDYTKFKVHLIFQAYTSHKHYPGHAYPDTTSFRSEMAPFKFEIMRIAAILNGADKPLKYLGVDIWASGPHSEAHEHINVKYILRPFTCLRNIYDVDLSLRCGKGNGSLKHSSLNCGRVHFGMPCFCPPIPTQDFELNLWIDMLNWECEMRNSASDAPIVNPPIVGAYSRFLQLREWAEESKAYSNSAPFEFRMLNNRIWKAADNGLSHSFRQHLRLFLDGAKAGREKNKMEVEKQGREGFLKDYLKAKDMLKYSDTCVQGIVWLFFPMEIGKHEL